LNVVSKALSLKNSIPILEGIQIKAHGSTVTLTATDYELFIERRVHADIKLEGEAVVLGRIFTDFIKKLTHLSTVNIEKKDDKLYIQYAGNETDIQCFNDEIYPEVQKESGENAYFYIKETDFKEALEKTLFCVAQDDTRPVLKGCLIEVKDGEMTTVALDGYRLALYKKEVKENKGDIKMIVLGKMLYEISKITEDNETEIKVSVQEKNVYLDLGHTKITTRLMEGDFIQYNKIIPANFTTLVEINKNELEQGLDRASLMLKNKKNNYLKLSINNNLVIIKTNSDYGSIRESIPCKLEGKDMEIAFNSKYLYEALNRVKEDYIRIEFTTSNSPAVLKPMDGEKFKYIILPVRLLG
jgi:DNA polymerase-3 subunit beta